jgi:Uma2 family endonuclease
MGAENLRNVVIAGFLFASLLQFVPHYLLHRGTEIAVSSTEVNSRFPDLMVMTEETLAAMDQGERSLVMPEMPAPALVVEVVSPGKPGSENYDRDYKYKPKEYADRGIPEYWRIDPERSVVAVMVLENGQYVGTEFRGGDRISSPTFPALNLTAHQILTAGREG